MAGAGVRLQTGAQRDQPPAPESDEGTRAEVRSEGVQRYGGARRERAAGRARQERRRIYSGRNQQIAGWAGYPVLVSPTVLRVRGFRFYFFSREERRPHVHVQHADGEAKFWIEPAVELHANYGLKPKQIAEAENLVEEHLNEIRSAWSKHFPG